MDLLDQKYPQTELLAKAREIISRVQIFEELQTLRTRLQGLSDGTNIATVKSLERQLNLLLNVIAKDSESDVTLTKKTPAVIRREESTCNLCGCCLVLEDLVTKDNPYSESDNEATPCGRCSGGYLTLDKVTYHSAS